MHFFDFFVMESASIKCLNVIYSYRSIKWIIRNITKSFVSENYKFYRFVFPVIAIVAIVVKVAFVINVHVVYVVAVAVLVFVNVVDDVLVVVSVF